MKLIYTTIPVEVCQYALVNRKVNHLLIYVYLKHISSGHIKYDSSLYGAWAVDLGLNGKTVRSCVKWLIKKKWITVNNKIQSLRIIGYKQLCKKLKFKSQSAVRYEPEDFLNFKDFCCASVVIYYLLKKRFVDRKRWSGSKMGDSSTSHYSYPKGYYTLPVSYLAKCLGVSFSTANNYKKRAEKASLITVKKNQPYFYDEKGNKLTNRHLMIYRYQYPEENIGRLRKGKKYLKKVEADFIKPEFSTMRKHFK
ncbi:hypothetical protein [Epilithonimonas hungarica]|uniref:Uncharacterized protein n=1 Tax=Epilithonimonas hungarica TaxID=454006 RepID=A0A1G7JWU9_9FLAO|nr:hypothetical protein [Epilithonimonas hungarica]SDF29352.1 hypothetical protein SAMN05421825_1503 [Epilithonimonas hungarica]